MKIAVAGGTGTVGAHIVRLAEDAGHETLVLSRSNGHDVAGGSSLDLSGVDAVIDAIGPSGSVSKDPLRFFETATRNLLRAEQEAGVSHHVALSIVGAARAPYGYYAGKAAQERLVAAGGIPWTILRATQFYEFAETASVRLGPVLLSPKMRSQPLAAAAVAARLVELAEAGPSGDAPDLAGPREWRMAELLRTILRAKQDRHRVVELPLPGGFGRALRDGACLPGPDAQLDRTSVEEWLATA